MAYQTKDFPNILLNDIELDYYLCRVCLPELNFMHNIFMAVLLVTCGPLHAGCSHRSRKVNPLRQAFPF